MQIPALDRRSPRDAALIIVAVLLSGVVHGGVAAGVSQIEIREEEAPVWVEMQVRSVEPPPPAPEPEPEPEPEPAPRPPPEPEVVPFTETTPEPPPPERAPVRRITQGLDNNSFLNNSGTGLDARRGTTTATAATTPPLGEDETSEFATVPYASVSTAPRIVRRPVLEIPQEIIDAEIQGRVEAEVVIGADGAVTGVEVVSGLHPAADAACVAALRASRWSAGTRDGTPVIVTGVPYSCRFEMQEAQ